MLDGEMADPMEEESHRAPVAFESADMAATDLEFVKPEFGDVRRVASFVSLDDLEVAEDLGSMPVFGVAPEPHEQLRDSSPEEDANNNSNDCVPMEQEDDSMVMAFTPAPKPLLISSYSMEAISSVREIETMSGPLLRGYLKSVGIEHRGNSKKRSELMQMLTREFLRYCEDPRSYMEQVAEIKAGTTTRGGGEGATEQPSGTRRTKKRSLKAREAEEMRYEAVPPPAKRLTMAASPPPAALPVTTSPVLAPVPTPAPRAKSTSPTPAGSMSPPTAVRKPKTKLAASLDPTEMTDEARLARYEAIARQVAWVLSGGTKAPPTDKSELLREFCSVLGFNVHGQTVTDEEQNAALSDESVDPLGKRIDVMWVEDTTNAPKWYSGTVVKKVARSYQVMYDDGEERAENLKTRRWRFSKSEFFGALQ